MNEQPEEKPDERVPKFGRGDEITVKREIAVHMELCTRAWIGLGEGRVLILKDDTKGLSTYYIYEEGYFTFYDHRGGSQTIHIEEITEIAGF